MKKIFALTALTLLTLATAQAQPQPQPHRGGSTGGPHFGAALAKLFGDNQTFTAQMEFETADPSSPASGHTMTVPGKMSFDTGKSRFEMNLSDIKGSKMPPEAAAQMKAMGMDTMVTISRPDKKTAYIIYTGMQSYVETPLTDATDTATADDFKTEITELGKETVDGHDCVKNKVVVSDKDGNKHESTVWDATDLKKFPVKIESTEQGRKTVMTFKNVTFSKPDAGNFEIPAGFTKYATPQEMVQAVMMKQMGGNGMMGRPPGQ
ncbi:MAG TPA: DUF4412 domain-containing protein [Verrucomicrobiae bacterium]|nr:DUF4412 domain-containing protein [Verrucomicrobiae bacterium]